MTGQRSAVDLARRRFGWLAARVLCVQVVTLLGLLLLHVLFGAP